MLDGNKLRERDVGLSMVELSDNPGYKFWGKSWSGGSTFLNGGYDSAFLCRTSHLVIDLVPENFQVATTATQVVDI